MNKLTPEEDAILTKEVKGIIEGYYEECGIDYTVDKIVELIYDYVD